MNVPLLMMYGLIFHFMYQVFRDIMWQVMEGNWFASITAIWWLAAIWVVTKLVCWVSALNKVAR